MKTKESAKSWIFILLFMVATAVIAALWPTLTGSVSSTVAVPNEAIYVHMPIIDKEINAPLAMVAIAAGATALIILVGVLITALFTIVAKLIRNEEESDAYAKNMAALAAQEKEVLAAKNKEFTTTGASDSRFHKWPTWGTAILTLFLIGSVSMMISRIVWPPTGDILLDGKIVPMGMKFVMYALLSTVIILAVFLRPSYVNNIDKTDNDSAPWTLYWVIVSGLVVVGLNIGFMLYLGS